MPVYEASCLTTLVSASANAPLAAYRASTSQRSEIIEVGISYLTAPTTSGGIGLARSSAIGTGTLTSVSGKPRDPSDSIPATPGQLITNWGTAAPTVDTASIFRRWAFPASLGNGVIWTYDRIDPMEVAAATAATSELIFINLPGTAPGTFYIYVAWEE